MSNLGRTWAGTHEFTALHLIDARAVDEVRRVIRDAARTGSRVRALGTRHSFHDLADSDGTLVTVTGIDPRPELDESAREVTVGAGTRYGVLAAWLEERGWALHNLGSLPHISIAGATTTGTHGSGDGNGVLSTAVRGVEFVDAAGEVRSVRVGDPEFAAIAVGLGAYGVAVRISLAIEPSYRVRQDVYLGLAWDELLADPAAVTGSAYSVSVFTDWVGDAVGPVWRKSRLADGDDGALPERWLGATRQESTTSLVGSTENLTVQGGVPGPWCERLPHFRLDSTPSNGDEIQSEYFVDRSDAAAALAAVREHGAAIAPHLFVTELRTARADDLWLSGASGRDTLGIHFTWRNEPDAVRALLPAIEEALAPFSARPHWGKWHGFDAERIAHVVPRIAQARTVFEALDPAGMFSNAHLERLGVRETRSAR